METPRPPIPKSGVATYNFPQRLTPMTHPSWPLIFPRAGPGMTRWAVETSRVGV